MFQNPYGAELAGREPKASLAEAAEAVRTICQPFDASRWRRSYAAGKWTAAQILVHLAQIEMMFGVRARFALTTGGYVVQVFEQDPFVEVEGVAVDGPTALNAFLSLRAMNLQLFRALIVAAAGPGVRAPRTRGHHGRESHRSPGRPRLAARGTAAKHSVTWLSRACP